MGDVGRMKEHHGAHVSKIAVSYVQAHACTRACVRSHIQTEGLARGYLSVTRWQAYAPDVAF